MKKLLFLLFSVLLLNSCKTKEVIEVPVPQIKTEIKYVDRVKYDSIYCKDSIYILQKGDTMYLNNIKYKYQYKFIKDTVYINKTDTITKVQKVTETKVTNKLNTLQKILIYIGLFTMLIGAFLIYKNFIK